jgi:hypothetical protein
MVIEIWTLIDITRTGVTRPSQGSQLEIDQHRNFITLTQCAELRSIVSYETPPSQETADIKGLGFGSQYRGKQKLWKFKFAPDRSGVYKDDKGNEVGFLYDDLHAVPVIKNLTETINMNTAIFDLKDSKFRNTIIKALPGIS